MFSSFFYVGFCALGRRSSRPHIPAGTMLNPYADVVSEISTKKLLEIEPVCLVCVCSLLAGRCTSHLFSFFFVLWLARLDRVIVWTAPSVELSCTLTLSSAHAYQRLLQELLRMVLTIMRLLAPVEVHNRTPAKRRLLSRPPVEEEQSMSHKTPSPPKYRLQLLALVEVPLRPLPQH